MPNSYDYSHAIPDALYTCEIAPQIVQFHSLLTVPLGDGMIDNVINNTGGPAEGTNAVPVNVVSFP